MSPLIAVVAIAAISLLEHAAIVKGLDGTSLAAALAAIGGIAGYAVKASQGTVNKQP